jgi:membrane-associated protease RseP (regulator of RpoE activity)
MSEGFRLPEASESVWKRPSILTLKTWGFLRLGPKWMRWFASLPFHLLLFSLSIFTTLVVGAHIAANYTRGIPVFDWDISGTFFADLYRNPSHLLAGIPFSFTLLGILMAHELGHYLTCRYYGIQASYPYFIPAPTLIGTLGAFIRIRSPIFTRRALFDVGISGPLAGFAVAIPMIAAATLLSKTVALPQTQGTISLGSPLAIIAFAKLLRPGLSPACIALHPVGCAAWVGLFATALNLLPAGQLDGGHILYALLGPKHKLVSRGLLFTLLPLGVLCWIGWLVWAGLLLLVGLRHPPLLAPDEPLDRTRKYLALVAALIFALCFVPTPFAIR